MSRVYLNHDGKKWNHVEKSDFWIDKALLERLDSLKMIQRKNWDGVILVDGPERSGKSVLGMLCGWYLSDGNLTTNNFALGLHDAAQKIASLPDKSVLIMDEGSTIFASRKHQDRGQKNLMEILDVVGQKNLFFIIILPCFFDLNKTIAVRRSKFLLHVYPDEEYNRGRYAFFGEKIKSKLYIFGKKNFDSYSFPSAEFIGNYLEFHPPFYEEYLEKVKKETLNKVLNNAVDKANSNTSIRNYRIELVDKLIETKPDFSFEPVNTIAKLLETTPKCIYDYIKIIKRKKEIEKDKENEEIKESVYRTTHSRTQIYETQSTKDNVDEGGE